jgi:hypothetical protein
MDSLQLADALLKAFTTLTVKETYEGIKTLIKKNNKRTTLLFTEKDLEENIIDEIRKTSNWAYDDFFKNHKEHSEITSRYVHLDLLFEPRREHINEKQLLRKCPLKDIITANKSNTVILGQPGSGKTTSIKYIVNSILKDPDFLSDNYSLPIVIRLRELNKSNSVLNETQEGGIFERLSLIFGLNFDIKYIITKEKKEIKKENGKTEEIEVTSSSQKEDNNNLDKLLKTKIIPRILDNQKILLILDGFDEIIDENTKDLVISEIQELTKSLNYVNFILTSRSADYKLRLENTDVYEISELNDSQIKEFSNKWFEDSILSETFLTELYAKTPYKDFYTRPLLLTQLALIYSRTNEIPDKPKMIYQRIVELVLKEWNEQQGIKRKTKYSTFTVERKREFLSNISFNLTIKHNSRVFSKNQLSIVYKELNSKFKELPIDEVKNVIEEIETHNGLIIQSGYDSFEFSHLTIQEYFVADYVIRTGNIRRLKYPDLLKIPNELAIAVALSSEPSMFLYDLLVDTMFKEDIDYDFFNKFFNRIKLEKPDFENNVIISITLLSVYTKICNKIQGLSKNTFISSSDDNKISMLNDNRYELEKLVDNMFRDSLIPTLSGYYEINKDTHIKSHLALIEFKKTKKAEQSLGSYNLPRYLYWKDDKTNK